MANPEPRTGDQSSEQVDTLASDVQSGDKSLRVRVDQDHCTGDGLCVQYAPQVFEFDIDGLAYVKDIDGELLTAPGATTPVPESLRLAVIDSADECPGDCIHVTDGDGTPVAGPAA
jgi:ferredoxin